jgi:hypothetical protein
MSFNPLAAKLIAELRPLLGSSPSVIELGNQSFTADTPTLQAIIEKYGNGAAGTVDVESLRRIQKLSYEAKLPETGNFYRALGFGSYDAIDINSKFGSLVMDLNLDLRAHYNYRKRFELVTNSGTGEHLFNQYQVFKNVHDLCAPNGLMLHVMPFANWLNHGFFNYQPVLYADLAAANDYELVRLGFANRWGYTVDAEVSAGHSTRARLPAGKRSFARRAGSRLQREVERVMFNFIAKRPAAFTLVDSLEEPLPHSYAAPIVSALKHIQLRGAPDILLVALLRKRRDADFVAPIQGKYASAIERREIASRYGNAAPL